MTTTSEKNIGKSYGKCPTDFEENVGVEELCAKTEKELTNLDGKVSALKKLKQSNLANNTGMMKAGANLAKEAENIGIISESLRETIQGLRQVTLQLQQRAQPKQGFSLGLGGSGNRESENNENGKGR